MTWAVNSAFDAVMIRFNSSRFFNHYQGESTMS
jgi:hypothetical protein